MNSTCEACDVEKSLEIKVIGPTGVFFEQANIPEAPCLYIHEYKRPSAGFYARIYLLPDYVNFSKVVTIEKNPTSYVYNTCSGEYWSGYPEPCPIHEPDLDDRTYSSMVKGGRGTFSEFGLDKIHFPFPCDGDPTANPLKRDATKSGVLEWKIDWCYARYTPAGRIDVPFIVITQKGRNLGGGNSPFIMSKANELLNVSLNDPETRPCQTYPPGHPKRCP